MCSLHPGLLVEFVIQSLGQVQGQFDLLNPIVLSRVKVETRSKAK